MRQNHHTFQRIFSAPFEVNFGAFFGPLAFAILLVLLGFLDSRPLFWPFLDGFLNVHLVADLRWIQRRLSHRFRASSWLGLPLELTYMFVRFERSLLRRDSVCRLTRHLNGNIPYCSFPWEYRPLIQSVVAWGIRRSEQRDLAFV